MSRPSLFSSSNSLSILGLSADVPDAYLPLPDEHEAALALMEDFSRVFSPVSQSLSRYIERGASQHASDAKASSEQAVRLLFKLLRENVRLLPYCELHPMDKPSPIRPLMENLEAAAQSGDVGKKTRATEVQAQLYHYCKAELKSLSKTA
jgi:hypothetical protein